MVMRIIRGFPRPEPLASQISAVTIGNFDGLHLGHQAILQRCQQLAEASSGRSVVVFFEPHPREYFKPDSAPERLSSFKEKVRLLTAAGIDCVVVLRFDQALACLDADTFCRRLLLPLQARHVIIGDDFRYGHQRSAGFEELREFGMRHGFDTEQTTRCEHQQRRISSSWVRECLTRADIELANRLLGRPYAISGRVIHGDQRGRLLNYPTANIRLQRQKQSLRGVFVTHTQLANGEHYASISNLGSRPVFAGTGNLLETHLFDFDGDLYGQQIRVEFLRYLRAEQKFASVDALQKQIDSDARNAREFHLEMNR